MDKEYYTQLIIQNLNNEISPQDKLDLDNWVNQSDINRNWMISIQTTWNQSNEYKTNHQPNQSKAWTNIETSINKSSKVVPLQPNYFKWASIAASILLLLSIGWYFQTSKSATTSIFSGKNEQVNVTLPDGSLVSLNENSYISYQKKFKTRNVQLKGEAYFNVQHNAKKPFKVITNVTETTVLGTTFNISAYPNEPNIDVSLFTGKIAFKAENLEQEILQPGEKISYNTKLAEITKAPITNSNGISWQNGILSFEQANLSKVISDLEQQYHKKIQLKLPANEPCVFTGQFENVTFEEIIEILSFTYDMNYEVKNNLHILTIKNCN